jgi:hypothetical protein
LLKFAILSILKEFKASSAERIRETS